MVWTPFGNSTTSTAAEPMTRHPEPVNTLPMPPQALQVDNDTVTDHSPAGMQTPQGNANEDQWYAAEGSFEGQLAVDVFQTAADIVIKAPIAGVSPAQIDIAITDDVVTIKGQRAVEESVQAEDYYCQECYYGVFSRSIILPVAVVTEQAEATFTNGVLTIRIPKAANARTTRLAVKAV